MTPLTRREFLQTTAAGAVLTMGVSFSACGGESPPDSGGAAFAPDAWIRIDEAGEVLVVVDRSEMGQGVSTSLPMIVAEELDADWSRVRYEFAPANKAYYNSLNGAQITGGSTSIMAAWVPLREAAARARVMLLTAAAAEWGVPAESCRTISGEVVHEESGRRLDYGALVARAALVPPPGRVALKDPSDYRLIGRPIPRLDLDRQVTGAITYGIDAGPAGALVAVIARCPVFGGHLRSFDATAALAVPGVRQVVEIPEGVAVVAATTWQAIKGREALRVEWEEGSLANLDSAGIESRLHALGTEEGREARRKGTGAAGLDAATEVIEARYDLPFLAHATMEPMCCTASVTDEGVTVWVPTQAQAAPALFGGGSRGVAADVAGVSQDRVTIHTTNLGGGFGRRAETDFVREAVAVAKAVEVPVRVLWTREDDIQHDYYRPISHHVLRAGVSDRREIVAWSHHIVAPSILQRYVPSFVPDWVTRLGGPLKGGIDPTAVEGAIDLPYAIPNLEVRYTRADLGIPVGFWRSVGHTHTAFVVETFIDELAAAVAQDPVAFRLRLLGDAPRHARVLERVAELSGWGTSLPAGWGRGVAVHESFGSFVAQVAEVEVRGTEIHVRRVVCAFDCGVVINPDTVEAQLQGAIVFGLTAALKGEITIARGRVEQSNFHDYSVLRMDEMPQIEVALVPSGDAPGGVGEPGTPPIAPAVANAIYAAIGTRVRRLPIVL
jgi:isoquinoline 1-oxidoreductase beta subunit